MSPRVTLLALLLLLPAGQGAAQSAEQLKTEATGPAVGQELVPVIDDALNRGTPRRSVTGYLQAAAELDFDKAAEYLDTRNLPADVAEIPPKELARQLNHVLSRSVWLDDYTISDNPDGAKGDGLPIYRDLMVTIKLQDGTEVPIWMQKVPRGDGESIWKVSNRSIAQIPELYDEYSYSSTVERIRSWFPDDMSFLGFEAFKWFIIIVAAILSWPFFYFFGLLLSRIFSSPKNENYPLVRKVLTGPLVALAILTLLGSIIQQLGAGAYARSIMETNTLMTVVVVWTLWTILTLFRKFKQDKLVKEGRPGAAKLLRPMTLLVKLFVIIFAILFWLNNAGVNISTVLAGLGVGGLAVALALQKPIEDMMGAITIFSQAPVRVGDLCRYGQFLGVIEDIGLRTTRMRTLTNTVISIPNSRLAYLELENLSYREKFRYWPTIRLRYDTRSEQIQQICSEIVTLLSSDEDVYDDGVRARFTDFDDDALLIKIHSFVRTTEFSTYLEIAERLNHGVMEIVHRAGAGFALPGRAISLDTLDGLKSDPS